MFCTMRASRGQRCRTTPTSQTRQVASGAQASPRCQVRHSVSMVDSAPKGHSTHQQTSGRVYNMEVVALSPHPFKEKHDMFIRTALMTLTLCLGAVTFLGCPQTGTTEKGAPDAQESTQEAPTPERKPQPEQSPEQETPENHPKLCNTGELCVDIQPNNARACELVLSIPNTTAVTISFDESVRGRWLRKGDRIAIVMFSKKNNALTHHALKLKSEKAESTIPWNIQKQHCYDWNGHPISNVTIQPVKDTQ